MSNETTSRPVYEVTPELGAFLVLECLTSGGAWDKPNEVELDDNNEPVLVEAPPTWCFASMSEKAKRETRCYLRDHGLVDLGKGRQMGTFGGLTPTGKAWLRSRSRTQVFLLALLDQVEKEGKVGNAASIFDILDCPDAERVHVADAAKDYLEGRRLASGELVTISNITAAGSHYRSSRGMGSPAPVSNVTNNFNQTSGHNSPIAVGENVQQQVTVTSVDLSFDGLIDRLIEHLDELVSNPPDELDVEALEEVIRDLDTRDPSRVKSALGHLGDITKGLIANGVFNAGSTYGSDAFLLLQQLASQIPLM